MSDSTLEKDKTEAVSVFKWACTQALLSGACRETVMLFKSDDHESATGHPISDDVDAVQAMIRTAPKVLKSALGDDALTLFEKSQLMNAVLSKDFQLDAKTGKIILTVAA